MKRIAGGALVGAAFGASKGIVDLHQLRHAQKPYEARGGGIWYVDKVTPPPTYVHAAVDQGIVGALIGGGTVGVLMREEYDRQQALRRVGHRAGRRDRAAHAGEHPLRAHEHEAFATTRPQGRVRSHTNTAHLLNDEDEDAGG